VCKRKGVKKEEWDRLLPRGGACKEEGGMPLILGGRKINGVPEGRGGGKEE